VWVARVRFHRFNETGEASFHTRGLVETFEGVEEVDVVDQEPASGSDEIDDAGENGVSVGKLGFSVGGAVWKSELTWQRTKRMWMTSKVPAGNGKGCRMSSC
jgi:hypothetical protein